MKSSKSAATFNKTAPKRAKSAPAAKRSADTGSVAVEEEPASQAIKRGSGVPAGTKPTSLPRSEPENVTPIGKETPLSTKRRKDASKGVRQEQKRLEPGKTTIVSNLDVGYGNALFIRGSGAGLTWEQGQALECFGPDQWVWQADNDIEPFEFKLLINDEIWSQGENFTATPGDRITCNPQF